MIPSSGFQYDAVNNVRIYDLYREQYVPSHLIYGGSANPVYFKNRIFKISTYANLDWSTVDDLNRLNGGVNYPEQITFYMSNSQNVGGAPTPNDSFCTGKILGKLNDTNIGYFNLIPDNYNYIRFITKIGWDTYVIIENIDL